MKFTGTHKECSKCGEMLPLDRFGKFVHGKHGLTASCVECRTAARRSRGEREKPKAVLTSTHKTCLTCKAMLLHSEFPQEGKRRLASSCRPCRRNAFLIKRYGITSEQYDAMVRAQNGQCLICAEYDRNPEESQTEFLVVDHNHETGELRGLLCNKCNMAIGLFRDAPALCRAAAYYLEDF